MPTLVATAGDYPSGDAPSSATQLPDLSLTAGVSADVGRSSSLVLSVKHVRPALLARQGSIHLSAPSTDGSPKKKQTEKKRCASSLGGSEGVMEDFSHTALGTSLQSDVDDMRLPSLSVVRLEDAQGASVTSAPGTSAPGTTAAGQERRQKAQLRAPNIASVPSHGLAERQTFVNEQYQAAPTHGRCPVSLHMYDLSRGVLGRHAEALTGIKEDGVFHSGLVCYGMEFYFEGGIGMAPAGRTRFGTTFEAVVLGTTAKGLPEFLEWAERREEVVYQLQDYHPVHHNCHHFSEEAAQFLLETEEDVIPRKLFTTTERLVKTDTGAPALEALQLATCGIQLTLARMLRSRALGRQLSQDMLVSASAACGVLSLPPPALVVFRVLDPNTCRAALVQITPYLVRVYHSDARKRSDALKVVAEVVSVLLEGNATVREGHCTGFTDLMVQCLLHTLPSFWGPLLDCLRIALLNKTILATVAYHKDLMPLILNGCRDFPLLQPDGRLGLLRVLCNLCCSGLGAAALIDQHRQGTIVATVGLALLDGNPMITYTAACLASNLSLALIVSSAPSLEREMAQMGDTHPSLRLLTILLYNLSTRSDRLDEPSRNMIITATLRIMSSNAAALHFVATTPFKIKYISLLRRCTTNESRSCLCIMKTLQELFA